MVMFMEFYVVDWYVIELVVCNFGCIVVYDVWFLFFNLLIVV